MELPKDWARIQAAYDAERDWRGRGELAIRQEMDRRVDAYFAQRARRKAKLPASARHVQAAEDPEVLRIAAALTPRPRLVPNGTSGHLNRTNIRNRDAVAAGLPRPREVTEMRRDGLIDDDKDIRLWRHRSSP